MNRTRLLLLVLGLLLFSTYFAYRYYFPSGPIMTGQDNPIKDRASKDWSKEEATVVKNPLKNVYFGDLHVHTSLSFDAFILGAGVTPDDAYRFAKGEALDIHGRTAKLDRPLDFTAVTDHAEFLGEMYTVQNPTAVAYNAYVPSYFRTVSKDTSKMREFFKSLSDRQKEGNTERLPFFRGYKTTKTTWAAEIEATERHYEPGKFTTLAGYEWTFGRGFNQHLHRNVIFRDMKVPDYPISNYEAQDEMAFYTSLQNFIDQGATALAIPHNTNWGEGGAFPDLGKEGAELRNRLEPLIEIHQAKGNSEVHAKFWTTDEFADFENFSFGNQSDSNYVRFALKEGLKQEAKYGVNPFKFGIIGSTDTHNAIPGNTEEDAEFIGNHNFTDIDASARRIRRFGVTLKHPPVYEVVNPGGLVAVWAEANTRGHIYDALAAKETYGTSGGRIQLRFFGGYDFETAYADYEALVQAGYAKGIAMGGNLESKENTPPSFLIWASKDAEGANLDRIQVIKGWYDGTEAQEKIYTVALSDKRTVNPDGTVPDNGATVDLKTGAWSEDKGAVELQTVWTDPDFNPEQKAFYYIRVLEVPTPSWRLWDQIREGITYPEGTKLIIRERAWSSPIWYNP